MNCLISIPWTPQTYAGSSTPDTYTQAAADKITTLIITDRHHAPFAAFEQQMPALLER